MSSSDPNKFEQVPALTVVREGDVVKRSWSDFVGKGLPTPSDSLENVSEPVLEAPVPPLELMNAVGSVITSPDLPGGVGALYSLKQIDKIGQNWVMLMGQVPSVTDAADWVDTGLVIHEVVSNFSVVFRQGDAYLTCSLKEHDEVAFLTNRLLSSRNVHQGRRPPSRTDDFNLTYYLGVVRQIREEQGLVYLDVYPQNDTSHPSFCREGESFLSGWYARETLALIRRPVPLERSPERVTVVYNFSETTPGGCRPPNLSLGSVFDVSQVSLRCGGLAPAKVYSLRTSSYSINVPEHALSEVGVPLLVSRDLVRETVVQFEIDREVLLRRYSNSGRVSEKTLSYKVLEFIDSGAWWQHPEHVSSSFFYEEVLSPTEYGEHLNIASVFAGTLVSIHPNPKEDTGRFYEATTSTTRGFLDNNPNARGVVIHDSETLSRVQVLFKDGREITVPVCYLRMEGVVTHRGFERCSMQLDLANALEGPSSFKRDVYVTLAGVCGSKEAVVLHAGRSVECHIENYDHPDRAAVVETVLGLPRGSIIKHITSEEAQTTYDEYVSVENGDGSFTIICAETDLYPNRLTERHPQEVGTLLYYKREGPSPEADGGMDERVYTDVAWVTQLKIQMGNLVEDNRTIDLGRVIDTAFLSGVMTE